MDPQNRKLRIAVLQRVCPQYRAPLFRSLSNKLGSNFILFIGANIPNSKVKSSSRLDSIYYKRLRTVFIKLGARVFPWHVGLISELKNFDPDVIICEGESHFIGYVQAIIFRYLHKKHTALIHWCFISLPGWPVIGGGGIRGRVKNFFRRFFDAFLVYSSYSKECLVKLGQPQEKIFVATNVGDVERLMEISDSMTETRAEARAKLELPERFTALYVGTLDEAKRPELMLDIARLCGDNYNFVLLGSGPLFDFLRQRVDKEELESVYLKGRVKQDLNLYFKAADVLVLPGRGGIVMSEAMAFGVPIIVHQADGTEYDLIQDGVTGFLVKERRAIEFCRLIRYMHDNPDEARRMGLYAVECVKSHFNLENMVEQILKAAIYAASQRKRAL